VDFAARMRELCDVQFPKAERTRVVLDNLSTDSAGALYQAFPAAEARRMLRRLEFHYTPKHASWLNMVEIEIGVLRSQCLDRRVATKARLIAEVAAWNDTATLRARLFNGCSQPTRPEPKWAGPIPTATSHNYRAAVLATCARLFNPGPRRGPRGEASIRISPLTCSRCAETPLS
jgi:hypothetical protein